MTAAAVQNAQAGLYKRWRIINASWKRYMELFIIKEDGSLAEQCEMQAHRQGRPLHAAHPPRGPAHRAAGVRQVRGVPFLVLVCAAGAPAMSCAGSGSVPAAADVSKRQAEHLKHALLHKKKCWRCQDWAWQL